MTRARSARRVWFTTMAALAAACCAFLQPRSASATEYIVRQINDVSRAEMRRLRQAAARAPAAEREAFWLAAGRMAVENARSLSYPPDADDPEVAKVLREACGHLSASALASLSASGHHPAVSDAFCRVVGEGPGPPGVPGRAEAAAEARDAVARFAGKPTKAVLEALSRGVPPARGAGGAQRSVYSILVLGDAPRDSTSPSFLFHSGVQAGIAAGAGAWARRFVVRVIGGGESEADAGLATRGALRRQSPGVVAVVDGSAAWTVASALGLEQGIVVADARAPGDAGWETEYPFVTRDETESQLVNLSGMFFTHTAPLRYPVVVVAGKDSPAYTLDFRPFQLRPSSAERARRLAVAIEARPQVRRVVVAIPQRGGDLVLAGSFLGALRALGRTGEVLVYEPGRRDYAPEAARFVATGAQAILFAGPGEESGEWLAALAARKAKPLVLGTNELDPTGFHERLRVPLEGAIYAGADWVDRSEDLVGRMRALGEAGDSPDFRRGYRFGWVIARAVSEGAYTPTSLRLALEQRSHPRPTGQFAYNLIGVSRTNELVPSEVVVPLFTVRAGKAVPLDAP